MLVSDGNISRPGLRCRSNVVDGAGASSETVRIVGDDLAPGCR